MTTHPHSLGRETAEPGTTSSDPQPPVAARLVVVVPAYQASDTIAGCLAALWASTRPPDAVLVVDDGSTDGTSELARGAGCEVLRVTEGPRGPARARNAGVAATAGELVAFVDSDVEVHPDALERLIEPLVREVDVAASFGSYDDAPRARDAVSLYANLRHHFVHQRSPAEAETFWAGLGCVRRDAFEHVGGFDDEYGRPSIEDVELGLRLRASGHSIRLVHDARGKHLKRWTLWRLWVTDVRDRALAWSRLLVHSRSSYGTLNLRLTERIAAALALLTVVSALAALLFAEPYLALLALLALTAWCWLNAPFLALLYRRGVPGGALLGQALHLAYYVYSSLTYVAVSVTAKLRPRAPKRRSRRGLP